MKNSLIHSIFSVLWLAMFITPAPAQVGSTFLTGNGLNGPEGFALDSARDLFAANREAQLSV